MQNTSSEIIQCMNREDIALFPSDLLEERFCKYHMHEPNSITSWAVRYSTLQDVWQGIVLQSDSSVGIDTVRQIKRLQLLQIQISFPILWVWFTRGFHLDNIVSNNITLYIPHIFLLSNLIPYLVRFLIQNRYSQRPFSPPFKSQ